jgi:hypothetical protein
VIRHEVAEHYAVRFEIARCFQAASFVGKLPLRHGASRATNQPAHRTGRWNRALFGKSIRCDSQNASEHTAGREDYRKFPCPVPGFYAERGRESAAF